MRFLRAWALAALFALAAPFLSPFGTTAAAQEEGAAESRAATFEAAQGAQAEEVPGGMLLIAAYGLIWLLLLGFVGSIAARQSRITREIARLREDIEAASGSSSSKPR